MNLPGRDATSLEILVFDVFRVLPKAPETPETNLQSYRCMTCIQGSWCVAVWMTWPSNLCVYIPAQLSKANLQRGPPQLYYSDGLWFSDFFRGLGDTSFFCGLPPTLPDPLSSSESLLIMMTSQPSKFFWLFFNWIERLNSVLTYVVVLGVDVYLSFQVIGSPCVEIHMWLSCSRLWDNLVETSRGRRQVRIRGLTRTHGGKKGCLRTRHPSIGSVTSVPIVYRFIRCPDWQNRTIWAESRCRKDQIFLQS
jgi:hypothetical protein